MLQASITLQTQVETSLGIWFLLSQRQIGLQSFSVTPHGGGPSAPISVRLAGKGLRNNRPVSWTGTIFHISNGISVPTGSPWRIRSHHNEAVFGKPANRTLGVIGGGAWKESSQDRGHWAGSSVHSCGLLLCRIPVFMNGWRASRIHQHSCSALDLVSQQNHRLGEALRSYHQSAEGLIATHWDIASNQTLKATGYGYQFFQ